MMDKETTETGTEEEISADASVSCIVISVSTLQLTLERIAKYLAMLVLSVQVLTLALVVLL